MCYDQHWLIIKHLHQTSHGYRSEIYKYVQRVRCLCNKSHTTSCSMLRTRCPFFPLEHLSPKMCTPLVPCVEVYSWKTVPRYCLWHADAITNTALCHQDPPNPNGPEVIPHGSPTTRCTALQHSTGSVLSSQPRPRFIPENDTPPLQTLPSRVLTAAYTWDDETIVRLMPALEVGCRKESRTCRKLL